MGASQLLLLLFFCNESFWLAHHTKKQKKPFEIPKIEVSMWRFNAPFLAHRDSGEKGWTSAKLNDMKLRIANVW
jgi:hypothetical protein